LQSDLWAGGEGELVGVVRDFLSKSGARLRAAFFHGPFALWRSLFSQPTRGDTWA